MDYEGFKRIRTGQGIGRPAKTGFGGCEIQPDEGVEKIPPPDQAVLVEGSGGVLRMNVSLDRENCIGCSACTTICPGFWSMGTDGKSMLKGGKPVGGQPGWFVLEIKNKVDEECNKTAADICPVKVIHLE
jgi:ferredoxin